MAILSITVQPDSDSNGGWLWEAIGEGADGEWNYLRRGPKPWVQGEATERAVSFASFYGLAADFVTTVDDRAEAPVMARHDGHVCAKCGMPIAPTGRRGRPRKVHADGECPTGPESLDESLVVAA